MTKDWLLKPRNDVANGIYCESCSWCNEEPNAPRDWLPGITPPADHPGTPGPKYVRRTTNTASEPYDNMTSSWRSMKDCRDRCPELTAASYRNSDEFRRVGVGCCGYHVHDDLLAPFSAKQLEKSYSWFDYRKVDHGPRSLPWISNSKILLSAIACFSHSFVRDIYTLVISSLYSRRAPSPRYS